MQREKVKARQGQSGNKANYCFQLQVTRISSNFLSASQKRLQMKMLESHNSVNTKAFPPKPKLPKCSIRDKVKYHKAKHVETAYQKQIAGKKVDSLVDSPACTQYAFTKPRRQIFKSKSELGSKPASKQQRRVRRSSKGRSIIDVQPFNIKASQFITKKDHECQQSLDQSEQLGGWQNQAQEIEIYNEGVWPDQ